MHRQATSNMDVSVIIPSYNRVEWLPKAVESVLEQSLVPTELIVVDDGSTDGTSELLAEQFPTVRVIRQENLGVSAARNAGIWQAKGQWIALLDSDDYWLPNKLEAQIDVVQSDSGIKVIHTDEIWMRNGIRVNPMKKHSKPTGWIYPQCLPLCCVSPSSVLIHQSIFAELGLFDESLPACEDYDMWLRIFAKMPARLVDKPLLVKNGGHEDQLSRKYWGMDRFRVKAMQKMLDDSSLNDAYRALTIEELKRKCQFIANGALKRNNQELANDYQQLASLY